MRWWVSLKDKLLLMWSKEDSRGYPCVNLEGTPPSMPGWLHCCPKPSLQWLSLLPFSLEVASFKPIISKTRHQVGLG